MAQFVVGFSFAAGETPQFDVGMVSFSAGAPQEFLFLLSFAGAGGFYFCGSTPQIVAGFSFAGAAT